MTFARAILLVALMNLGWGAVEAGVSLQIGSVALWSDSVDFFEDAALNLLILLGVTWRAPARAALGRGLAVLVVVPTLAAVWMAWSKLSAPVAPDALSLGLTAFGALAINLTAAAVLVPFRTAQGSLATAAWLSARNDVLANIAIIGAAVLTAAIWRNGWPDLFVGLGILWLNLDAALKVWRAAAEETDPTP